MKIGFRLQDIKVGGQYHDEFLNRFIRNLFTTEDRFRILPRERMRGGFCEIEIPDDELPAFTWFENNHTNIKWDSFKVFIDAPVSVKTNLVPAWWPNPYVLDEDGEPTTQRKTFEEYGAIGRDSVDGTKCIIVVTPNIIPNSTELAKLITALGSKPSWNAYTYGNVRGLLDADYTNDTI